MESGGGDVRVQGMLILGGEGRLSMCCGFAETRGQTRGQCTVVGSAEGMMEVGYANVAIALSMSEHCA